MEKAHVKLSIECQSHHSASNHTALRSSGPSTTLSDSVSATFEPTFHQSLNAVNNLTTLSNARTLIVLTVSPRTKSESPSPRFSTYLVKRKFLNALYISVKHWYSIESTLDLLALF